MHIPHLRTARRGRVGFLFLGELHLIPHLLPIALALARRSDPPAITLHVVTSCHEEILADALARLGLTGVTIRRVRGFRRVPAGSRDTPSLPHKILTLLRNAVRILREDVVVVAERTSLWLPMFARIGTRFIYNEHGAGPHANFRSRRNRFADRLLMPGEEMARHARVGARSADRVEVVGYLKPDYARMLSTARAMPVFPEARPVVVYVPHWLREKSSWWGMGETVLDYFARSDRYNLILAPHIRLPKFDPELEKRIARFYDCSNIHIDATSFRLIDQTYTNGADIYLGDGSSQVLEFATTPRPAIFLNPNRIDWRADSRFSHWALGDVAVDIPGLDCALAGAIDRHADYAVVQRAYVEGMMGAVDGRASERAAGVVADVLAAKLTA